MKKIFLSIFPPGWFHSIRTKLILSITLIIVVFSWNLFYVVPHRSLNQNLEMTRVRAESISEMTAYSIRAVLDFGMGEFSKPFNVALQNKDIEFMVVLNKNDQVVHAYNLERANEVDFREAKNGKTISDDEMVLQVMTPVMKGETRLGEMYVGLSLRELRSNMSDFQQTMAIVSFIVVLFGILAAYFISKIVTKPLSNLVDTMDEISKGDLTKRVEIESKDEIGKLAGSFNLMVESLEFAVTEMNTINKVLQAEIDERKKAEEELRKLSQAIIQSPVSIMITNTSKIIEYVNPKFLSVTGFEPNEILGKKSGFLERAERDPNLYNKLWSTIIEGKEWKGEFENTRKNGEHYWEIVSISAIKNADGKITHFITVKEDITEIKQLEENSRKYDFIVNTSKDMMALVNKEYVFEAVNESYCNYYEKPREELVGISFKELLGEEVFVENVKDSMDECLSGKEVMVQAKFGYAGKEERYWDIHYYPFKMEGREVTHVAWVAKDVTQRKISELILKESEERYKGLVSRLPDVVLVHQHGKVVYTNDVIEEFLGMKTEDVIGKNILDFIPEEYKEQVEKNITNRLSGEDIPTYEIEIFDKSGGRNYIEIRGASITYGREPAILNVIVNINERKKFENKLKKMNEELEQKVQERTAELSQAVDRLQTEIEERKEIEESLRNSEEKFRALAEYSNDAIIRFDRELHHLYVNRAAERILRLPKHNVIGKSIDDLNYPAHIIENFSTAIGKVFSQKVPKRVEFRGPNENWIDLIVSPEFTKDNEVKTVLTSSRDITKMKKNEEELIEAKEQALEASRLKSEFLANMSHEIRTPMNAILGFTDLMSAKVEDKQMRTYLDAIRAGGKNLLTLINDILDLSKIEAGKMELNFEPVNPFEFINEIKNIFSQKIVEKNLEFIIHIDSDLPESLLIDEVRLRQILFNLIGNAVKFTESGYIKLTLEKEFIAGDRSTLDLKLSVEDTGIGIPEGSHKMIFESFKQQDGQSTKKFGGTGLGLAITRRLVEMMGGDIHVESEVDKGSKFVITIYHVYAATAVAGSKKETIFDHHSIEFDEASILIVDDVPPNRSLIKEFLRDTPFTISEAEDGLQAVEFAKKLKPALILMDIRMPVLNGYDATKKIRQITEIKHTPIIAITASAMKEDRERILESGFDGYLMKPIQISELYKEISQFIPHQRHSKDVVRETQPKELELSEAETNIDAEHARKVIDLLKADLFGEWEKVNKTHFVQDVISFAVRLQDIAKEYEIRFLKNYAEELQLHSGNFDIESMISLLKTYPDLIEKLQKFA